MKQTNPIKLQRDEAGASKHLAITHFNSPSIFETSNGILCSVLKLEGVTFDVEQDYVLNNYKRAWHRALMLLDSRFGIYVTIHRRSQDVSLHGEFDSPFLREIDSKYHEQYKTQTAYINDIYITLVLKGITSGKVGKGIKLFDKLSNAVVKAEMDARRAARMKVLTDAIEQLKQNLSDFKPRILGKRDEVVGYSEIMDFLSKLINGGEGFHFKPNSYYPAVANSVKDAKKTTLLYPRGNVSHYLARKRLFFGEYIQFQGASKDDKTFGAILSIKNYGNQSASIMLDSLLHVNCHLISTNSFLIESKDIALTQVERHIRRMQNVNDPAVSQLADLQVAKDSLAGGNLAMGYHSNTILLLSKTKEDLEQQITRVVKCFADAGIAAVRETIGLEPAYWAQVPSNHKYIARSAMITTENFIDFASLHNYRTGYKNSNHLGEAVTILETPSKTPFFFNYHTRGTKTNPSKGHTMIVGGNDSGKTVLMTFFDAQISRYNGCSYFFDRNQGVEIYIRAVGGQYYVISPDCKVKFNPLLLEDTPRNRQFCLEWLIQLCRTEENEVLSSTAEKELRNCIDYAFQIAKSERTLSKVCMRLPVSFEYKDALSRWQRNQKGSHAYLFDNNEDTLTLSKKMGFDMTHFLDNESAVTRTAVMMYLFHRIDLSMDGQLVSIVLDEGWQYLADQYWQHVLSRWLPTLRKNNGHIILGTQSPATVVNSPISHVIKDNRATQIYFCNPQAEKEIYMDGMGLTESEFTFIKSNPPNLRLFLIKQEHDSVVCKLNLGHLQDIVSVLSGNKNTVNLLTNLRETLGDDPENWLPEFYRRKDEVIVI